MTHHRNTEQLILNVCRLSLDCELKTAEANQVPGQRSELKLIWLPHSLPQTMGARERELASGGQGHGTTGGGFHPGARTIVSLRCSFYTTDSPLSMKILFYAVAL